MTDNLGMREERPSLPHQMPHNFSPKKTDLGFLIFLWMAIFSSGIARLPFKYQHANQGASQCHLRSLGKGREEDSSNTGAASHNSSPGGRALFCLQWRMQRPNKGKIKLLCVKTRPSTISSSAVLCQMQTHPQRPWGSRCPSKHAHSDRKHAGWLQNGCIGF